MLSAIRLRTRRLGAMLTVAAVSTGVLVTAGSTAAGALDGALDTTFGTGGKVITHIGTAGENNTGRAVAVQANGKVVAVGFASGATTPDFAVARYNTNGTLDTTFDGDAGNGNGVLLTDFGSNTDEAYGVAIQTDGKIVVVGRAFNGSQYEFAVARYNTNGTLDTTFSDDGKQTTALGSIADLGRGIAIQTDGKIVVVGTSYNGSNDDFAVVRYNTNGTLDTSFSGDGKQTTAIRSSDDAAWDVAIQDDGKLVVAGWSYTGADDDFAVVRYNTNGTLDTTFDGDIGNGNGKVTVAVNTSDDDAYSLVLQPDGRIVVVGVGTPGAGGDIALVRLNTDGTLDTTFGTGGKVLTSVDSGYDSGKAVALQVDGKLLVAGLTDNGSNYDAVTVRYKSDGTLDPTFGVAGKVITALGSGSDNAYDVALQADGKVVAIGDAEQTDGGLGTHRDFALIRYTGTRPVPRITSISPSTGPVAGGTPLTIEGAGFATTGAVKVLVGGKPCTSLQVLNDHRLTCFTPAGKAAAAAVKITNPNRTSVTKVKGFTYLSVLARPQVFWTRQSGGIYDDTPSAVATGPGGDIWVYGSVKLGAAGDAPRDLFLARYTKSGVLKWRTPFFADDTDGDEQASQHIVVLPNGDVVVTGTTTGKWLDETKSGGPTDHDVFVARYSKDGVKVWAHQFGTANEDYAYDVAAAKNGDLYVSVETTDAFPTCATCTTNTYGGGGKSDAVVMKLNSKGELQWSRQFGSTANDYPWQIAVSRTGEVYLVGSTQGDLDGEGGTLCNRPSTPTPTVGCTFGGTGEYDAFLIRLNVSGGVVWAMQSNRAADELVWGVATGPGGDVYISGSTDGYLDTSNVNNGVKFGDYDGFTSRYTKDGVLRWTAQHGTTAGDYEFYLAVAPSGAAYVSGYTYGAFPGYAHRSGSHYDAYVLTVSPTGKTTAVQQLATPTIADDADYYFGPTLAIAPGGGLILATATKGATWGNRNAGGYDVALSHIPVPGANAAVTSTQWVAAFGGTGEELITGVQTDPKGNTYVYGQTGGTVEPSRSVGGGCDLFVAKFDPNGNLIWKRQFGTSRDDYPGNELAVNSKGEVFVSGSTQGAYPGQTNAGSEDVFVAKLGTNGLVQWFKQFGTSDSDQSWAITLAPSGAIYVQVDTAGTLPSGTTSFANTSGGARDSGLTKLDKNGNLQWTRQFGGAGDEYAYSVRVGKNAEVYVAGNVYGSAGLVSGTCTALTCPTQAADGFIGRFDANGAETWMKVYGNASNDYFNSLSIDQDGNLYATGGTDGYLSTLGDLSGANAGASDGIVAKIDTAGSVLWIAQQGGSSNDGLGRGAFAKDANGWLWVAGLTDASLGSFQNQGSCDAYVFGISPTGTQTKVQQFGTEGPDGLCGLVYIPTLAARANGTLVLATQYTKAPWGVTASAGSVDIAVTSITLT